MKKMRIIAALSLILCLVTVLSSCGAKGILSVFNEVTKPDATPTVSKKIDGLAGTVLSDDGDLVLLSDAQADKILYKVYNVNKDAVVYEQPVLYTDLFDVEITLGSVSGVSYFTVVTENEDDEVTNAKLYGSSGGAAVVEALKDPEYAEYNDEVIVFNGSAYGAGENGAIVKLFDVDEFSRLGSADVTTEEYNYLFDGGEMIITDKQGAFVNGYNVESYADEVEFFVLENGNVVIQYMVKLPDDVEKYDALIEESGMMGTTNKKVDLVTKIFNVKRGTVKDANVDFVIKMLYNRNTIDSDDVNEKYKYNLATILRITDKRIDNSNIEMVSLNNRLGVKQDLSDIVDGGMYARYVGGEKYAIYDRFGNLNIVTKNGKVEKTVPSGSIIGATSDYIVTSDTVYDYDFNKLYDLKGNGYDVVEIGEGYIILSKATEQGVEYARYHGGTVTVIITASATDSEFVKNEWDEGVSLYCIKVNNAGTGTVTYNYYTAAGALVGAYNTPLDIILVTESGEVFARANLTEYYRLTATA